MNTKGMVTNIRFEVSLSIVSMRGRPEQWARRTMRTSTSEYRCDCAALILICSRRHRLILCARIILPDQLVFLAQRSVAAVAKSRRRHPQQPFACPCTSRHGSHSGVYESDESVSSPSPCRLWHRNRRPPWHPRRGRPSGMWRRKWS